VPSDESLRLETELFSLREVRTEDLDGICAVFEGNPGFLALRDNVAAPSGGYDPASVRQYCEGALLEPSRHLLSVTDNKSGTIVGLVDFIDQSPADELPWIGLVIVHRAHQRTGAGTAVVQAVAAHLASLGNPAVRMAVIDENTVGLRFVESLGFEPCGSAPVTTKGGLREALLFELALPLPDSV
jgi:RimJ/RimL family protein N-acetyltransferase